MGRISTSVRMVDPVVVKPRRFQRMRPQSEDIPADIEGQATEQGH